MKKFFLFIVAILLLSSCAPCGECSTKYKVIVKSCNGNTLEEYYSDDAHVVNGTAYLTIKDKIKSITGGIVIIEQL